MESSHNSKLHFNEYDCEYDMQAFTLNHYAFVT
jgi:hypothetical protein